MFNILKKCFQYIIPVNFYHELVSGSFRNLKKVLAITLSLGLCFLEGIAIADPVPQASVTPLPKATETPIPTATPIAETNAIATPMPEELPSATPSTVFSSSPLSPTAETVAFPSPEASNSRTTKQIIDTIMANTISGFAINLGTNARIFNNYIYKDDVNKTEAISKFVAADIPLWAISIPIIPGYGRYFNMTMGTHVLWGLSKFFFDPTFAVGFQYYPFGKIVSLHGTGYVGTFLLNNITFMAGAGIDVDIPLNSVTNFTLGGEYFYHHVVKLANFIPHDQWYINSDGFSIRAFFRFRIP